MTNEAGANRNPSFGLGDVMQEIRGMGHLMHTGARMAEGAVRDVQKIAEKGKAAGGTVATAQQGAQAARSSSSAAKAEMFAQRDAGHLNMTDSQIEKAADKLYSDQMKSFGRNWAYNKLTGQDRPLESGKGGPLRVGQMFKDERGQQRQATQIDVQEAAELQGKNFAKQIKSGGESENAVLAKFVDPHKREKDKDEKNESFSDGPTPGV